MKYLKAINEYSNVLYHEIDYNEYIQNMKNVTDLSDKNVEIITNKFNQKKDKYSSIASLDHILFLSDRKEFNIYQLEDEYYLVKIYYAGNEKMYKCDTIEGVLQLINLQF